jgi:iron complex outermembrane recepter protein
MKVLVKERSSGIGATEFSMARIANGAGMLGILVLAHLFGQPCLAQDMAWVPSPAELKKLSIEELLQVPVTAVSKKEERLLNVPASVSIISQEDIRRSGATSLPEALRLSPQLHVAQVDSRQWAISARGFNATVANKLLVMIDGRSIYTPLFSGVFWDAQHVLLEDVDRIEVVSGPGGTMWGANAVNGVINVVTKNARDTQGLLVTAGGGTELRGMGAVRYGGKASENLSYRVYGTGFHRDSAVFSDGSSAGDDWDFAQGGFRLDWDASTQNVLTLQGDVYDGQINQRTGDDIEVNGGNVLGRWMHTFADQSDLRIQMYYDGTRRRIPETFGENLHTYDFDLQHRFQILDRHDVVWGAGYRHIWDEVRNSPALAFIPEKLSLHFASFFVQDEIALMPERLYLTLGSKFEHNHYTGFEYQPNARLMWRVTERQAVWGAVSRAVRTPSRIDRHFFVPGEPPHTIAGGPNFGSEELLAYEIGYRVQPHRRWSVSMAAFHHLYDDLRSVEPGPPAVIANGLEGETYGLEFEASLELSGWWRLKGGYTYLEKDIRLKPWSRDINQGRAEGSDPKHLFKLRSFMDLPGRLELDAGLRYVDTLHAFSAGRMGSVPNYVEVDLRLGWWASENLEFSVIGQNLAHRRHPEFGFPSPARREIERRMFGKVTWRF